MNANEEYLEKLLRSMMEPEEQTNNEVQQEPLLEESVLEDGSTVVEEKLTEEPVSVDVPEINSEVLDEPAVGETEEFATEEAVVTEETVADEPVAAEEPAPVFEPSDDPGHIMTPEEIAALIAGSSEPAAEESAEDLTNLVTEEIAEITIEEPTTEELAIEEPAVEEPVIEAPAEELAIEEPAADEPAPVFEPSDDPGHIMTPEEIAALIAGSSEPVAEEPAVEEPVIEVPAEELAIEEPAAEEPVPVFEPSDDPGHIMTPEEIAALIAGSSEPAAEESAEDLTKLVTEEIAEITIEEPTTEEPAAEEPAPVFEPSDDPGHIMTPEEIAALIAGSSEPAAEEPVEDLTDLVSEELAIEEPAAEELAIEAPAIDETLMGELDSIPEDLLAEELDTVQEENEAANDIESIDPDMLPSEESLADLLEAIPELEAGDQKTFAVPEGINPVADFGISNDEEPVNSDDSMDLSELSESDLDSIGEAENDDMSELASLLSEDADADMLSLLDSLPEDDASTEDVEPELFDIFSESEEEPQDGLEVDEEKSATELLGFSGNSGNDGEPQEDKAEKKPGLLARIIAALFGKKKDNKEEELEEEQVDGVEYENPAGEENVAILQELDALDEIEERAPEKKEKPKKEKKKKEKKPKKEKKKKEKKPKKERPKKERPVDNTPPGKPISKKFIIAMAVVCASFLGLVYYAVNSLPNIIYAKQAREAFAKGDYEAVYKKLAGLELKDADADLYEKSLILMKMKRLGEDYNIYFDQDDKLHALDILVQAVDTHDQYAEIAWTYGVGTEYEQYYSVILTGLAQFGLDENSARGFADIGDSVEYSIALEDFIYGPQIIVPNLPEELMRKYTSGDVQGMTEEDAEDEEESEEINDEETESEEEEYESEYDEVQEQSDSDVVEDEDLFILEASPDSKGKYHAEY